MPNRLADASSPYLRQHADNPVDWWPWSADALDLARREDRPILLSIGYSACHWCHVMAHESFEDEATAAVMNDLFVNIKLDREERPDLDRIYQLAHQALTRRGGGWPLTVFLTPGDHLPYFAGTYFPKTPRHGLPSFVDVLKQVRAWYDQRRDDIAAQNRALGEFLENHGRSAPAEAVDPAPLADGVARIAGMFDPVHGGFGAAPKFPHAADLRLLRAVATEAGDEAAAHFRHIVRHSLRKMAEGGIHDQLGGGFCRYSVDAQWAIPHFEKMLYDNALLLPLYARAAAETGETVFATAAQGIGDWLGREMKAPDGGYHAALDADSEGEEGKYYVWRRDELRALLDDEEFAVTVRHYGLDQPPNFEEHAWNLLIARPLVDVATGFDIDLKTAAARLASARSKLIAAREARVRPGLDDKRLTAWNALLAAGFAEAAIWLERADFAEHTREILAFLRRQAWRDGRLFASVHDGEPYLPAYLDDHAFLLAALLEMLRIDPDPAHLRWAVELSDLLLEHFEDDQYGGFFFTADDHEALIARPKPFSDEAMPSGNGLAALSLQRLGHLLGETRYLDAAERALRAAHEPLKEIPHGCAAMLLALREHQSPSTQIVIRLPDEAEAAERWRLKAQALGQRDLRCVLLPPDAALLPQYAPEKAGVAYVCEGTRCLAPARSLDEIEARLEEIGAASAV